ncbi:MAG: Mur ligase family protein, partial [Bdellovibrionota bacterium]
QKRIHILGVAGTLMGAFAAYLKRAGIFVTGSDQNIYPPMSDVLKSANVEVFSPFAPGNLDRAKPDLVIVGNVIRKVNPEMQAVLDRGIPYMSLPQALETMVLPEKHSIVVAGTHGKTTTTSILAWMLEQLGESPSFFVGGVLRNFPESFRVTDSRYMVLEGDEYDTAFFDKVPKFTHYCPKDVILTSVEYDHADIYPDINSLIRAFDKLAELTSPEGFFIACAEYETPLRIAHQSKATVLTYGFGAGVDSRATHVDLSASGATFRWQIQNKEYRVKLTTPGKHNLLNALACLTLAHARQWDVEKAIAALSSYQGVKRRQEIFGQAQGITLIDDFAHHPTAVRETLSAIRAKYPESRIVACFEPRSATSRRRVFQQAYTESFDLADAIYVAKPYEPAGAPAQTSQPDIFSTEELVQDLAKRGKKAKLLATNEPAVRAFSRELKTGDIVLVMSNGSFDGLLPRLLSTLSE